MEFLHADIAQEYERWLALVGADDKYRSANTVGFHHVLKAHFLVADFFADQESGIGGVGPKSLDMLHSALYRQFVGFGGKEKWPSPMDKLATLVFGLIKDHPFHDANKRTAFLVMLYQLETLGRIPRISQKDFEDFVVDIADNQLSKHARYVKLKKRVEDPEVEFISDYMKRSTREIDKRIYSVTFNQLNQIIKPRGFELKNPYRNYIDVVRYTRKKKFFGMVDTGTIVEQKILTVGFPGWKNEVDKTALRAVREATGLTHENGYDSKVFFQGADPLHILIDRYSEPLRRLADR